MKKLQNMTVSVDGTAEKKILVSKFLSVLEKWWNTMGGGQFLGHPVPVLVSDYYNFWFHLTCLLYPSYFR